MSQLSFCCLLVHVSTSSSYLMSAVCSSGRASFLLLGLSFFTLFRDKIFSLRFFLKICKLGRFVPFSCSFLCNLISSVFHDGIHSCPHTANCQPSDVVVSVTWTHFCSIPSQFCWTSCSILLHLLLSLHICHLSGWFLWRSSHFFAIVSCNCFRSCFLPLHWSVFRHRLQTVVLPIPRNVECIFSRLFKVFTVRWGRGVARRVVVVAV